MMGKVYANSIGLKALIDNGLAAMLDMCGGGNSSSYQARRI